MITIEDCREVGIEEAIKILVDNPGGYVERYAKGKTTKIPALFQRDVMQYMEVIDIQNEKMDAYDLVMLLVKYGAYTQTDEYLKGE